MNLFNNMDWMMDLSTEDPEIQIPSEIKIYNLSHVYKQHILK
jgi:hypothetical protein